MSSPVRLASFCRLCLTKTKDKVPIFADGDLLENLLHLIDIEIDPNDEPDAVVCYDCVVTLEGFHQFKEQCHANDEFVRTVPAKSDCSASSAELVLEVDEEEENAILEENNYLELSEAEEIFQERPKRKVATEFNKKMNVSKKKNVKVSTIKKPGEDKSTLSKTLDELQVLAESYPDFFYFEKGARSISYTMVLHGERYNSALFSETNTRWQCTHRKRYRCPAHVIVTNDYKTFQRSYDHTHGVKRDNEGQAFTPHEALPEIFQICKTIILQKQARKAELASEEKVDSATVPQSEPRPKRKIQPNLRYAADLKQPKKRKAESKKQHIVKSEPKKLQAGEKPKSRFAEKCEREIQEKMDASKSEDDTTEEEEQENLELDLEKIKAECDALKIPQMPPWGSPLDDQLVLADSYPDNFFFEKGSRSLYYTLVYYGERYNSAQFRQNFTYWMCAHRRKYKCPAHMSVTNDYKTFERRYEHSHPALPDREGEVFTPKEALPELFKTCRKIVLRNRVKRLKKLLNKYKSLKSIKSDEPTAEASAREEIIEEEVLEYDEYEELIEEPVDEA